jgi:hypothetical protein
MDTIKQLAKHLFFRAFIFQNLGPKIDKKVFFTFFKNCVFLRNVFQNKKLL